MDNRYSKNHSMQNKYCVAYIKIKVKEPITIYYI